MSIYQARKNFKLTQIHIDNYKEIRNATHNISVIPARDQVTPLSSRCMPIGRKKIFDEKSSRKI